MHVAECFLYFPRSTHNSDFEAVVLNSAFTNAELLVLVFIYEDSVERTVVMLFELHFPRVLIPASFQKQNRVVFLTDSVDQMLHECISIHL